MTTIQAIAIVRAALKSNATAEGELTNWIPPRTTEAMQYLADFAARELLKPATQPTRPRRGRGGR
jgi:hypothetical protein